MNVVLRKPISIGEFLAWEREQARCGRVPRVGADWTGRVATGERMVRFPGIGVMLPLQAAYVGIEFLLSEA